MFADVLRCGLHVKSQPMRTLSAFETACSAMCKRRMNWQRFSLCLCTASSGCFVYKIIHFLPPCCCKQNLVVTAWRLVFQAQV